MSARAASLLLARGIVPGESIAIVIAEGAGPFGETYAKLRPGCTVLRGEPIRVHGARRPKSIVVRTEKGEVETKCDAVLIDALRSPSFELAEQVGAELVHAPFGFVVRTDRGRIAPGVWAVGEVTGTSFERAASEATKVAALIVDERAEQPHATGK